MPFSMTAKNGMLDSRTIDRVRLHSGDPGASGTDNALGAGLVNATFSAASSGSRALATNVTVTGLSPNQSVTHFSVWDSSGSVFQGSGSISTGDTTANAAGEYIITTSTTLSLTDS